MKTYIERRFADGEPEDRSKSYLAKCGNSNGVIFIDWDDEWAFQGKTYYVSLKGRDITYLEETTIDSDLYQKANPTDHAEFVHHIAQEVASAIWESTGKGNSHFNQVDINHIAEICAEEIISKYPKK